MTQFEDLTKAQKLMVILCGIIDVAVIAMLPYAADALDYAGMIFGIILFGLPIVIVFSGAAITKILKENKWLRVVLFVIIVGFYFALKMYGIWGEVVEFIPVAPL